MFISNRLAAYPPLDPDAVLWSNRPPGAGTDLLVMMHGWSYDERHLFALRPRFSEHLTIASLVGLDHKGRVVDRREVGGEPESARAARRTRARPGPVAGLIFNRVASSREDQCVMPSRFGGWVNAGDDHDHRIWAVHGPERHGRSLGDGSGPGPSRRESAQEVGKLALTDPDCLPLRTF